MFPRLETGENSPELTAQRDKTWHGKQRGGSPTNGTVKSWDKTSAPQQSVLCPSRLQKPEVAAGTEPKNWEMDFTIYITIIYLQHNVEIATRKRLEPCFLLGFLAAQATHTQRVPLTVAELPCLAQEGARAVASSSSKICKPSRKQPPAPFSHALWFAAGIYLISALFSLPWLIISLHLPLLIWHNPHFTLWKILRSSEKVLPLPSPPLLPGIVSFWHHRRIGTLKYVCSFFWFNWICLSEM